MRSYGNIMKLRTTAELDTLIKGIGAAISAAALISLFFVKSLGGAVIILLIPLFYFAAAHLIFIRFSAALMEAMPGLAMGAGGRPGYL